MLSGAAKLGHRQRAHVSSDDYQRLQQYPVLITPVSAAPALQGPVCAVTALTVR